MMDDKDIFSFSSPQEPENKKLNENEKNPQKELNGQSQSYSLDLNSFSSGAVDNARKQKSRKKKGKQLLIKSGLTVFLIGIMVIAIILGSVGIGIASFSANDEFMENINLDDLELNFTTTIYTQNEAGDDWVEYQRLHGEFNRIWVPYNAVAAKETDNAEYNGIPQQLVNAFVAVEDKRFYDHYGVDWKRTFGSLVNVFIPIYSSRQGGSTITQQLVKNLSDDRDQSAMRKVREILRARELESKYYKDTIIECYLNTIPMGHGIYGVEVAANYYFGKSVNELTLLECASLASITKAPSNYAPDDNAENNKTRRETVLALMLDSKFITQEQHDAALKEEFKLVASKDELNENEVNNYFVDALIVEVTRDLADKYGWDEAHAAENFYSGGYKIYATVDPKVQNAIDEVFTNSEKYGLKGKDGAQMQGSITVMDYQGRVRGLSGGIGEKKANLGLSGFNRATDAIRQPGSTMKPIAAYAPAIEDEIIHYSTIVNDSPVKYAGWTPKNWYGGYWGGITVQYALERSVNTIPVYLVDKMGTEKSYNFLTTTLGITTLNENDIALSPLGMGGTNGGITTKESAAAYAIFGNGGMYYEPTLYYAVFDQHNDVVLSHEEVKPTVAIGEDTATVMNKLLQNVVYGANGTGGGAGGYIKNMRIYAKTGTSNDSNDLWFVGGSPYYVASCWCGYDNPQTIRDAGIAMRMWGAVMSKVHSGLEPKSFVDSEYAQEHFYCTESGNLATDGCPSKAIGWYKKNNVPNVCRDHDGSALDTPEVEAQKAKDQEKKDNTSSTTTSE